MMHLPSGSLQGAGQPSIPIACKLQNDALNGIAQGHRFFLLGGITTVVLFGIVPGAIDFEQFTEAPDGNGLSLLACLLNDRMPLL
ncbi:hypothetical protein [Dictyobacter formicarum]|uniref:hypothetical protein n=1 Tax=Dictyobacter formicarum TaxID=2778368 RepID=UPI0019166365|nr:hypothetical protein [Dictyobacter formicarum]